MKIVFSPHAVLKIEQRGLSRRDIIESVTNPGFTRLSYGLREELYKIFGRNYLKVIVKREEDKIIIITAHWLARFRDK